MSNNDLSDNGKNFEFGYDSTNDSYGYYKDGVFSGFGGGGVSTKCIIKGMVQYLSCVPFTRSGTVIHPFMMWFDNDGTTETIYPSDDPAQINIDYATSITKLSFISQASFRSYSSPVYAGYYCDIYIAKDGFYSYNLGDMNSLTPSFLFAGTRIGNSTTSNAGGDFRYIIYYGMELPS